MSRSSAGKAEQKIWRWFPSSLLGRVLLLTLLAMASAQIISSAAWIATFRAQQVEGLVSTTRNLAQSAAATAQFFNSLPLEYRHIVLDQLRDMGGTRFFVSLNDKRIDMEPLPNTERKRLVTEEVETVLRKRLGNEINLYVDFVDPADLRILNTELPLDALPRSWAHYALTLEPLNPPVLVTQIEVADGEWLYLAAALPAPFVSLEDEGGSGPADPVSGSDDRHTVSGTCMADPPTDAAAAQIGQGCPGSAPGG
jgi:hypothetical protein